jgi:hypothetical protein
MMEGSGSGRSKNIWIPQLRIQNSGWRISLFLEKFADTIPRGIDANPRDISEYNPQDSQQSKITFGQSTTGCARPCGFKKTPKIMDSGSHHQLKRAVWRIRDVYPGSPIRLFSIPDPGSELSPSRIPDPHQRI